MKVRNLLAKSIVIGATAATLTGAIASYVWADGAKDLYDDRCAGCHGPSGKGDGPAAKMLQPAPQNFATALKGKSDDYIKKIIKEGGAATGKSASMPAASDLSDDQVKSLADYIKHL
ncbi:MAG: cytochrome c [Candidatus Binataceae bacterium]